MKDQFIPYEEALGLNELGFNEPCLGYYNLVVDSSSLPLLKPVDTDFIHFRKLSEPLVKTPLYQQAFDWFRKRGYYFEIYPDNQQFILEAKEWYYIIKKGVVCTNDIKYYSYEEARLACLAKLIELIKSK